jgi:TPR repeat protein
MGEAGDTEALLTLGEWHLHGNPLAGVQPDPPAAARFFQQAHAAGDPHGRYYMALMEHQNASRNATSLLEGYELAAQVSVGHIASPVLLPA